MQCFSFDEPGEVCVKILNNVWCVGRAESKEIGSVSGKKEKGMRRLSGAFVCVVADPPPR